MRTASPWLIVCICYLLLAEFLCHLILDAVPGQAHESVARVFDTLSTVPMPISSKNASASALQLMDQYNCSINAY